MGAGGEIGQGGVAHGAASLVRRCMRVDTCRYTGLGVGGLSSIRL